MSETKALAPIDVFRQRLAGKDIQTQLLNYLGQDEARLRKMQSAVLTSVQKVPDLLQCDQASMMQAVIACAEINLYPSAVSGECFILPYKGKAQFQLGYQGLITLMYAAGVDAVNTQIVYANDTFRYEEGLHPVLEHVPTAFGKDKGEAIGCYGVAELNGTKVFKAMDREAIMKIKALSAAKDSKYSPWNGTDPELWMWRKTVLKQLAKTLPKNERLNIAISRDNEESIIHEQIENRRVINPAQLKEKTQTMGDLTIHPDEEHDTHKKTSKEKAGDLFDGVADNNSRQ